MPDLVADSQLKNLESKIQNDYTITNALAVLAYSLHHWRLILTAAVVTIGTYTCTQCDSLRQPIGSCRTAMMPTATDITRVPLPMPVQMQTPIMPNGSVNVNPKCQLPKACLYSLLKVLGSGSHGYRVQYWLVNSAGTRTYYSSTHTCTPCSSKSTQCNSYSRDELSHVLVHQTNTSPWTPHHSGMDGTWGIPW